jgi:hypothetical protein
MNDRFWIGTRNLGEYGTEIAVARIEEFGLHDLVAAALHRVGEVLHRGLAPVVLDRHHGVALQFVFGQPLGDER